MKQVESSEFKSVENGFEQKVNDQNSSGSLTNHNNIRVGGMGIHSSDRGNFYRHIFAELKYHFFSI